MTSMVLSRKSSDSAQERGIKRLVGMILVLLVLPVAVTSCGGETESPDPTSVSPTATTQPTQAPVFGSVIWTTELTSEGIPNEALSEVTRDASQIIAALEVRHLPPETTFAVSWSMDGTPLDALATTVSLSESESEGWVTATLTWNGATLWPVGTLAVSFEASSGETISGAVQIISG